MDSPARRLFNAAQEFEKISGLSGLLATDRIFGMLEREFEASEVRVAVATALRPEPGYVLDAHRTLLDLSRIRGGAPRIVTTNFDLLSEECEQGIDSFNRPRLPDPGRANDFRGVIHLHGRVDADYRRACDDEFVLSSADLAMPISQTAGQLATFKRSSSGSASCLSDILPTIRPSSICLRYSIVLRVQSTPCAPSPAPECVARWTPMRDRKKDLLPRLK